jgi:RimJ/RimL family protein N-acetyltransferase
MRFEDWFDQYSPDHMKAYETLSNTGCWPPRFVPEDATMSPMWCAQIESKMARAWLLAMKRGQIIGSCSFNA